MTPVIPGGYKVLDANGQVLTYINTRFGTGIAALTELDNQH